jgi:hypothetical protein
MPPGATTRRFAPVRTAAATACARVSFRTFRPLPASRSAVPAVAGPVPLNVLYGAAHRSGSSEPTLRRQYVSE